MNRRRKSEKGSVVIAQSEAWSLVVAGGRWATTAQTKCSVSGLNVNQHEIHHPIPKIQKVINFKLIKSC
jgi:endo-1,4-beta-D-glucanase Y